MPFGRISTVNVKKTVEERCRSAEQFAETRRQLEHDRTLLQNGLRQMESQLRWVASSISLSGGPLPESVPNTKHDGSYQDGSPQGEAQSASSAEADVSS